MLTVKYSGAASNFLDGVSSGDYTAIRRAVADLANASPEEDSDFLFVPGPTVEWAVEWEIRGQDLYVIAVGEIKRSTQ